MKKLCIAILALALLLTGCADYTDSVVTDSPEPEVDLEALETLLESDPLYRLVLSSSFSSVEEVPFNWKDLLRYFSLEFGESKAFGTLNSKVREELKKSFPSANINTTFFRLFAETAVQEMERRLGIALTESELEDSGFVYCAADGYYYADREENTMTSDGWFLGYDPIEVDTVVLLEDGTVEVCYRPQSSVYTEIYGKAVLCETDGIWMVLSNEIEIPMLNTDADPIEPGNMNADTLAQYRMLLESDWYRNALTSFYASPATVNLFQFFYSTPNGYSIEKSRLSDAEKDYYVGLLGEWFLETDNACISASEADAVLTRIFGITLDETEVETIPGFTYDPKHDSYLHVHGDANAVAFDLHYGIQKDDGTVELYYKDRYRHSSGEDLCVITLRDTGEGWQVVSNLPVDPLGAMSDSFVNLWAEITSAESWYLTLLATEFASPEEIDPWPIFSNQPASELTDGEKEFLSGIWGEEMLNLDVTRVPADELDAVLREYTYGSLEQLNAKDGNQNFPYFPETDCYYLARGGVIIDPSCVELLYCDDTFEQGPTFYYLRYGYDVYVVQFKCLDEGCRMAFNLPVGEKN